MALAQENDSFPRLTPMTTPLVRYQLAVSLDGFIGPEDGSVDWLGPYDAIGAEVMGPFMEEIGGLVMGRVTYETLIRLGGWPFGDLPTVVLSSSKDLELGLGFELCNEGPGAAVAQVTARMKSGDIWLVGGGQTAAAFLEAGLLDRVQLTTLPVVLGSGMRLFAGLAKPATLELQSCTTGTLGTITEYAKQQAPEKG